MKYRLALLDEHDHEVGAVTALEINPRTVLVMMPPPDYTFGQRFIEEVARAFEQTDLHIVLLTNHAQFVRLEQVDE